MTLSMLHDAMDYTPYEGIEVTGWPTVVVSRGEVVAEGGEPVAKPGRGIFLRCDLPAPAKPLGRWPFALDPRTILG